ncbi:hypothetical protein ACTXJX_16740 [Glutamicibacter ardleyensis]
MILESDRSTGFLGMFQTFFDSWGTHDPMPFVSLTMGFVIGLLLATAFFLVGVRQRRKGEMSREANMVGSRVAGLSTSSSHTFTDLPNE